MSDLTFKGNLSILRGIRGVCVGFFNRLSEVPRAQSGKTLLSFHVFQLKNGAEVAWVQTSAAADATISKLWYEEDALTIVATFRYSVLFVSVIA